MRILVFKRRIPEGGIRTSNNQNTDFIKCLQETVKQALTKELKPELRTASVEFTLTQYTLTF
jgi:hypothetical protein